MPIETNLVNRRTIQEFGNKFLYKINQYKYISIFLHIKPDFDAYASMFSLYYWIKLNFPNKEIALWIYPEEMSQNEKFLFDWNEDILVEFPDRELKESLGIIVDTPNQSRVLTQKHYFCSEIVIIDHHPRMDSFAQLEFINHTYSSTSEILGELFLIFERSDNKYVFEPKISRYLYAGIITDSNFLRGNSTPQTFFILWKILEKGINRKEINNLISEKTLNKKLFDQEVVRNIRVTPNGLAFAIVSQSLLKKYLIQDYLSAITNLEGIGGVQIWVILIEDPTLLEDPSTSDKKWKSSIRSKELPIDGVAKYFGGGGHKNVSSVLFKKRRDFFKLLLFLDKYLIKFGYSNASNYQKFGRSWNYIFYKFLSDRILKVEVPLNEIE
ncbi:tRNA-nucleotidyltransferase/poly(A) polymerase family protein [Mycoplasma suis KI3806]|uniref:tRNA-nucleotidyltransferase/poly(A) polymerase family protein n=1 Tax=Mycoplasma suis (strain KI_3806) TaxID=708248 RepID=F0V3I5_MYCS3|nr:bifunctional oligoribonuclease/PAP phosphatase NrnA [Mycoplasma suis]CBZ40407.1 tRNA-nucleotidyltransferase/poly(A) polymerase family protein [Mycoplasma suis KI3806]